MINKENILSKLHRPLTVELYGEVESTNLLAKEYGDSGVLNDMLVIAESQTGGRGRLGRSFHSPSGGLYMSLLLHPKNTAGSPIHITTAAAVAVCRAIEAFTGQECLIKWVNDVYMREKKVCGILTEARFDGVGDLSYAVLGIGINLSVPEGGFPEDIKNRAGALYEKAPDGASETVCAAVINEFMRIYDGGLMLSDYLDGYRRRSFLIGKKVNVMPIHDGESVPAQVLGVSDGCGLIVRYTDGTVSELSSGDVSVREG